MAEINTSSMPPVAPGGYSPNQTANEKPVGAPETLSKASIEALQRKALEWLEATHQAAPQGMPGVSNANGAPELDGVVFDFSADDLAACLRLLDSKTKDAQLKTTKESIELSKLKMSASHKKAIEKIQENAKKCADAQAAQKKKSIFGWLSKIFSFVASIIAVAVAAVATIASGGAGLPALALSICALASSTMSLAGAIAGKDLSFSTLLAKPFTAMLQAFGVPEETAKSIGKIVAGAVALVAGIAAGGATATLMLDPGFLTNIVAGGMELGGVKPTTIAIVCAVVSLVVSCVVAGKALNAGRSASSTAESAGKTLSNTATTTIRAGSLFQAGTTIAAGCTAIRSGAAGIEESKAKYEGDLAMIEKKKIDASMIALTKSIDDDSERLKKILQEIEDGIQSVSQLIAGSAQSMSDIAQNLSSNRVAV